MSSKRILIYGIVALCLLGLYIAGRHSARKPKATASGNLAPDFSLADLDGRKLNLARLQGQGGVARFLGDMVRALSHRDSALRGDAE